MEVRQKIFHEFSHIVGMSGSKIHQVRETMQIFLRSLPEGTMFNIVSFGSDWSALFPGGSKEYFQKVTVI